MTRLRLTLSLALIAVSCKGAGEPEPSAPRPANPEPTPNAEGGEAGDGAEREDATQPVQVEFDEIVYRFQDASVPPPHHRSVTITAKPGSILRVVDSYGDEIERAEAALDDAQFRELVEVFRKAEIRPLDADVGVAGCAGGTSESVRLLQAGKEVFSGTTEHCGGSDTPNFRGDLQPLISALKSRAKSGPTPD